ncbi:MAG TPA: hypothetical protein VNQ79_20110 [Blastocatellia bacterium]|nr:hypothetical protein [Blastocatellia bacterium]
MNALTLELQRLYPHTEAGPGMPAFSILHFQFSVVCKGQAHKSPGSANNGELKMENASGFQRFRYSAGTSDAIQGGQ